jgi:uncharacterized membrane protein YbhN (UPF0104 family)
MRSRRLIVRLGVRLVRTSQRLRGRPVGDPEDVAQHALDTLSAFRMRPREWIQTILLSFVNWLASVGCLVASILAVGAGVPWTKVILIYCAGAAASSFNLTPGGLGVTEAVLTTGFVASGLRPAEALGSVLVFRAGSFIPNFDGRRLAVKRRPNGLVMIGKVDGRRLAVKRRPSALVMIGKPYPRH